MIPCALKGSGSMRIDLKKLISGDVRKLPLDYTFPIDESPDPEHPGEGTIDTEIDGVVYKGPVRVKGEIANLGGYMRLRASATVDYEAECARCLKPLGRSLTVEIERTLVPEGSLENTPEEEADDYLEIVDSTIDPDESFVEELMMEFPTRELCSEDCKGLCPKCGKDLNEGDCGCVKKEIDPRLAVLQKLLEKE